MRMRFSDPEHQAARVAGIVLAIAAAYSVLSFGGADDVFFAGTQITIALLGLVLFWQFGLPPLSLTTQCILGILAVFPLVQMLPIPSALVKTLSPQRVRLAESLKVLDLVPNELISLTIDPHGTTGAFLRLVCYLLVFLIAIRIYNLGEGHSTLAKLLIGLGIFEASYGIVQYLTGLPYIFFYQKKTHELLATGTYINRNHYAGLLEMTLPFLLAGILFERRSDTSNRLSSWRGIIVSPHLSRGLRNGVFFALIFTGLIFSLSRGGITAALAGVLVTAAIAAFQGKRSVTGILFATLTIAVLYTAWIGVGPVYERFRVLGNQNFLEQDRLPIWRDTLALIRDFPITGTGLGSYEEASLHYQSQMLRLRYSHAHNDYLEIAGDVGIPMAALFWGSLLVLFVNLVRSVGRLPHARDNILATGCAGAMVSIFVHSLTDFNLQIPANALIFAWIAGTAVALIQQRLPEASGRDVSVAIKQHSVTLVRD
ncbi:MAG: hypothetical protein EXQ56_08140 [Acidobacteria bacterium]|nr:hypothetical protein [Acidobacteriota bacterium]